MLGYAVLYCKDRDMESEFHQRQNDKILPDIVSIFRLVFFHKDQTLVNFSLTSKALSEIRQKRKITSNRERVFIALDTPG